MISFTHLTGRVPQGSGWGTNETTQAGAPSTCTDITTIFVGILTHDPEPSCQTCEAGPRPPTQATPALRGGIDLGQGFCTEGTGTQQWLSVREQVKVPLGASAASTIK